MKKDEYQAQGLSKIEAAKRLEEYGPNQLFVPSKIRFWSIAKQEITEPIILLLFAVGFFYSIWGKLEDTLTIIVVVSLLVFTEVFNEFRAKKAINALSEITSPKAKVLRDGNIFEIKTSEVVVGDILILFSGSKISADAKLLSNVSIAVDESALTGESIPVEKTSDNDIFAGTIVVSGEAMAEVIKTGASTKIGLIAKNLVAIKPKRTKLQLEMKALAGKLLYWAVAISILIPIIGILRGEDLKNMILTGLALSFAIIPEELPMIITMVLGLGAYSLSKKSFLVKKINAAEILGTITTIVTDKTGTLTSGVMSPVFFYPTSEDEIINKIASSINSFSPSFLDKSILKKIKINNYKTSGEVIRKRDMGDGKKTISTIIKTDEKFELILRGAPEEIFLVSKKVGADIKAELEKQTKKGRRVIAIASKIITKNDTNKDFDVLEKNLDFIGLIGFEDSPRPNVKETITRARRAGIRTIMATGDHPETARYIAQQVGIKSSGIEFIQGDDISKMSDDELDLVVKETSIFARVTPNDKYRIVKSLQNNGEIVGVTGDGINDSLALKKADIGIAMGVKGTDVAKEAAGVVLADDNFITISNGIFEGRKLFDNLKKGIKYYLSVKLALVFLFLLPVLFGVTTPFAPIQIIILELFMDLAASAGYVAEPIEKDIYGNFKSQIDDGVLGKKSVQDIFIKGLILFLTVMTVYLFALYNHSTLGEAQTLAFSAWVFSHIFLAFVSRSDRQPIMLIGAFKNKVINLWGIGAISLLLIGIYWPALGGKLNLVYINPLSVFIVMLFTLLTSSLVELRKYKF